MGNHKPNFQRINLDPEKNYIEWLKVEKTCPENVEVQTKSGKGFHQGLVRDGMIPLGRKRRELAK